MRATDPALVRAWLGDEVRRAILATPNDYTFRLHNAEVAARRIEIETDEAALTTAMHAVAALGGAAKLLLDRWRLVASALDATIAGETFVPGQTRFEGEHQGRPIAVDLDPPGVRITRSVAVRFEIGASAPLPRQLFAGAETRWSAIQPARFACDGEVATLSWEGYVPDLGRVTDAAALLTSLEPESAGPYR